MIIHAASTVAVFVNQVAQAPVQIQCAQCIEQDSYWARLLIAVLPSFAAAALAFLAARLAFNWSREKDQKQWVRDQKTGEWKELLVKLRDAECQIPVVFQNKHWSDMFKGDSLLVDLRGILPHLRNNVFIDQSIRKDKSIEMFEQFLSEGAEKITAIIQQTKEINEYQERGGNLANDADPKENIKWAMLIQEREADYAVLSSSFHLVCEKLRATKSLDLESSVY